MTGKPRSCSTQTAEPWVGVTPTEAAKKQDRGQSPEMRKGAKREEAAHSDQEVMGKALPKWSSAWGV